MNSKVNGAVGGAMSGYEVGGPIGAVVGGVLGAAKNQNTAGLIDTITKAAFKKGRMPTPAEQMQTESPLSMDSNDMANATNFATNLWEGDKI